MRTLGVIVAGGHGRRLGLSGPKALLRVGAFSLLDRAIATLEGLCDRIVVAAPPLLGLPLPKGMLVQDVPGAEGPLAGLVAGLDSDRYDRAIALGVDFPLVRPSALNALLDRLGDHSVVLPAPGGVPQPLVAAYGPAACQGLKERLAAGERSVVRAVASISPLVLSDRELAELEDGLDNFFNLNTPDDRAEAEYLLRARADIRGTV
ncbi:MAG TPA: molybdenum cofactor guanylyltransferase [Gemmatimonadales bacterium]|nr:molybdenum cofactor guanylyltransferase [Gemmatimonadales bacterium]